MSHYRAFEGWNLRTQVPVAKSDYEKSQVRGIGNAARIRLISFLYRTGQLQLESGTFHDRNENHPHPLIRRSYLRRMQQYRERGWRAAQIKASIRALDLAGNEVHRRWLAGLYFASGLGHSHNIYSPNVSSPTGAWNALFNQEPWAVPTGIPLGEVSVEDEMQWGHHAWEVELAALLELEEDAGGIASLLLHDIIPDETGARAAVRQRVATYLAQNRAKLPEDPWDPNVWGHDARLKSLTVKDSSRTAIEITPSFDPDIEEYTVDRTISGLTVRGVQNDGRAAIGYGFDSETSSRTVTVRAMDGTTVRVYRVSQAQEEDA